MPSPGRGNIFMQAEHCRKPAKGETMVVFGLFGKKKEPAQPIVAPQNVKLCKGCGLLLQADELHCKNCGHKEKFCPHCKKTIPEKEIRCMYCGQMV